MFYISLFIFGLIVGSFLNVVAFRYSPESGFLNSEKKLLAPRFSLFALDWFGRSKCSNCGKQLRWYELIPVISFIIQKGKCRSCKAELSLQYPLVELATGLIFLLPIYFYNPLIPNSLFIIQSIFWVLIFLIFLLIWSIDYRLYIIPNELVVALALLGIGITAFSSGIFSEFSGSYTGSFAALFGLRENIWVNHLAAALVGIAIVALIILLSRGKGMGMGDLKLMGALGLIFGWPDILFIFIFGSLIGGIVSGVLLLLKQKTMKDMVPFGPFLILGAAILFFFGEVILRNYFNFFGL